jgi:hypothetical protein
VPELGPDGEVLIIERVGVPDCRPGEIVSHWW